MAAVCGVGGDRSADDIFVHAAGAEDAGVRRERICARRDQSRAHKQAGTIHALPWWSGLWEREINLETKSENYKKQNLLSDKTL